MVETNYQENLEVPKTEQSESIKLYKNSRGYNWEIRILSNDIDRIIELNNKMVAEFGGGETV